MDRSLRLIPKPNIMRKKSVSKDLSAAIKICKHLSPAELLNLRNSIQKNTSKEIQCSDQWNGAIEVILINLICQPFSKN